MILKTVYWLKVWCDMQGYVLGFDNLLPEIKKIYIFYVTFILI